MIRKSKTKATIAVTLLFVAAVFFTALSDPVSAANKDGMGVHADPATFQKNYSLTVNQKEYAITKIDRVVSKIIKPEMSDLEKYYRLALWEYRHAKYDSEFWSGQYNFEYYRHQWDAYGVLTDKSVCAGMAITYANLCHAADLPCKFVRLNPKNLDHTINYIPNINGNAYYVDVTEDGFLMSKDSCIFADSVDAAFANITQDCTDGTFDYSENYSDPTVNEPKDKTSEDGLSKEDYYQEEGSATYEYKSSTPISECIKNYKTFDDWFKENALHQDTDKDFRTDYVELGSGESGTHYASYHDYESQCYKENEVGFNQNPGIWFLEDFYKDPAAISEKILNKELDEQLLDISGVKASYADCDTAEEFATNVESDILVRYFPTAENDQIVAWEDDMKTNIDYTVTCDKFDKKAGTGSFIITGEGEYKGSVKVKAENLMTLKGRTATVKYSNLKKKAQSLKRAKAITVSKAQGKLSYEFLSAYKGEKSVDKYFKVNAKTGNITLKKGMKKGTYKVNVNVKAAGNDTYKESAWKTVTFNVRVK